MFRSICQNCLDTSLLILWCDYQKDKRAKCVESHKEAEFTLPMKYKIWMPNKMVYNSFRRENAEVKSSEIRSVSNQRK